MHANRILTVVILAVSGLLNVAPAVAQQQMIPVEVVQHLMPGLFPGESGAPQILVGSMPESVAGLIAVPPGGRVIGSAVFPRTSRVVLGLPAPAEPAVEAMRERLIAAGWWRQVLDTGGGFQSSATQENSTLCGPSDALVTLPGRHTADGEQVVMMVHIRDTQRTGCNRAEDAHQRSPRTPIPSLPPPPGAQVQSSGGGGGGAAASARATVRTALSPHALLRHYAAQLREHGWIAGEEAVAVGHAAQAWTLTDEEGHAWFGVLTAVVSPDGNRRMLRLEIERAEQRP